MKHQKILILNFGGQYDQLIARRVRECHVYCEVRPYTMTLEEIKEFDPMGIIFTGGPDSVYKENSCHPAEGIFDLEIPILGICYGCQLLAYHLGGLVTEAGTGYAKEYGKTRVFYDNTCLLFEGLSGNGIAWMSHGDYMEEIPEGFKRIASSLKCPNAAICNEEKRLYGVQFHPEVNHTENGTQIIRNFLYKICNTVGDWTMEDYMHRCIRDIREKVGDGSVLLALSGGVDSSVCAALIAEAIGKQLTCVFVDHGLLRKNEGDEVEAAFQKWDIQMIRVDAKGRFLERLAGISDPEEKRKIIGEEFIRVFEEEGKKIGKTDILAQGTIYPDVIESGKGKAETIKSHHNVGGLPDFVDFKEIMEPLRMLFKDEVRELGRKLGLPEYMVVRQPFPGPGLAIRIVGEITEEKLEIVKEADAIFREEVEAMCQKVCDEMPVSEGHCNHSAEILLRSEMSQYFAALTNMKSVGVMGDGRTYDWAVVLRSVTTEDFMTADWTRIPYEILDRVSTRIVNEVPHVNRVLYDITSKPPATVEFE